MLVEEKVGIVPIRWALYWICNVSLGGIATVNRTTLLRELDALLEPGVFGSALLLNLLEQRYGVKIPAELFYAEDRTVADLIKALNERERKEVLV